MGMIICLQDCPIIWQSKLLKLIVLSTLEAEYMALSQGLRELLVVKRLLQAMVQHQPDNGLRIVVQSRAYEDNAGALLLATRDIITARTRYFLARWHWFWQHYDKKEFEIQGCDSDEMRADFLTKQAATILYEANCTDVMGN